MKNWKKNVITAAILVTVCSGIYLNWVYTGGDDTKNLEDTLDAEKVMSDDLLYLGDNSVEVGGNDNTTITDYFAAVRLSRQEARDKAVSLLQEAMAYGDENQIAQSNAQLEQIIQNALYRTSFIVTGNGGDIRRIDTNFRIASFHNFFLS